MYNNLGGQGPLAPTLAVTEHHQGIRYINVGTAYDQDGNRINIDLLVTNRSTYTPFDPSLNGLATGGKLVQINVACNTDVDLRVNDGVVLNGAKLQGL